LRLRASADAHSQLISTTVDIKVLLATHWTRPQW
jgi:hypothetical protein